MFDRRLARFVVVGLGNTTAGLLVIFGCKGLLHLGDLESNLVGYGLGILLGFVLNKRWTFEHSGTFARTFARYVLVLLVAYLANLATTLCAIEILDINSYVAHVAGIFPYAALGYLGGRYYVFARLGEGPASGQAAEPAPARSARLLTRSWRV